MENIHKLDDEMLESLVNMFNSKDTETIKMALAIINNADFNDSKIVEYISKLQNYCSGLSFTLFKNKKGNIRAWFRYILFKERNMFMVNDDSSFDTEWILYEPPNDLSK